MIDKYKNTFSILRQELGIKHAIKLISSIDFIIKMYDEDIHNLQKMIYDICPLLPKYNLKDPSILPKNILGNHYDYFSLTQYHVILNLYTLDCLWCVLDDAFKNLKNANCVEINTINLELYIDYEKYYNFIIQKNKELNKELKEKYNLNGKRKGQYYRGRLRRLKYRCRL